MIYICYTNINVRNAIFTANGYTSTLCNLNSRWNYLAYKGCFDISFTCRLHSSTLFYGILGFSWKR